MKKFELLPKGATSRRFITILSGTASAQLIVIAAMPIVTRMYTPEMIGVISIFLSFFNFWSTFLALRYDTALLVAKDEEESHQIFRVGAVLVAFMSILALPVLYFAIDNGVLGFDILPVWSIWVCTISLFGFGMYTMYRSWLLWLGDAKIISYSTVARSLGNVAVRLGMGAMGLGVVGLFLAEIAGAWSALAMARNNIRRSLSTWGQRWQVDKMWQAFATYKKYPLFEVPSSFFNQLALLLPIPIIGMLYGAQAAGWFGLAKLLFAIPNKQIGGAIADVFQMELSKLVRHGELRKGERIFYKFALRLALVGLVPLIGAMALAPFLAPVIFGSDWAEMGVIVAYIAPWMYAALVVSSLCRALSVLQRQELKFLYDFLSLFIVAFIFFLASANEWELYTTLAYLTVGMCGAYLVYFGLIATAFKWSIRKHHKT